MRVDEVSLGDYVLAGGEVAVLVIAEAVGRLLPGVLGNTASAVDDSFAAGPDGLLEAPAYTKPASWRGLDVPPVLLSGHHAEIERWRAEPLPRTHRRSAARTCSAERRARVSGSHRRAVASSWGCPLQQTGRNPGGRRPHWTPPANRTSTKEAIPR